MLLRVVSMRYRWALTLILLGYLALALTYSLITPPFEASDELWHYPMVKYVADHNFGLPVQRAGLSDAEAPWRQEGSQPPLYYYLGALLTRWIDTDDLPALRRINPHANLGEIVPDGNVNMVVHSAARESWPWSGAHLALRIVRMLSIGLGAGTVVLTYLLGRALIPDRPAIALAAAAFTAYNPMFLFISAVVNNDNLATLLATALLLQAARLILSADQPIPLSTYALLGLTAGAGMLAKFQIGFLLPILALILLGISLQRRDWRPLVLGGAISGGLTILIAGWWYWRNYDLYGDATGINIFLDIVGRRAVPADLRQLWNERETFMMAFWGFFGGVNVPLPGAIYTLFNSIAGLGALGLVIGVTRTALFHARTRTCPPADRRRLILARALAALWAMVVFVSLLAWTRQTWASQGRLWFSAIAALNLGLAAGLAQIVEALAGPLRKRASRPPSAQGDALTSPILMLALIPFAAVALVAPFTVIRPAYTLERDAAWEMPTLEGGSYRPACFREPEADREALCLAYREVSGALRPGDVLHLAPMLTVKQRLARDWSLFVHLVNSDGTIEAQRDVYPGGGLIATSDLLPGDAWNNLIAVTVPRGLYTPQTLDIYLGFYDLGTFDRMRLAPSDIPALDDRLWIGRVQLEPSPGSVPNPVDVNFADLLTLRGYTISDRSLRPGDSAEVTLYWQPHAALGDYIVSAQFIDPDPGRLIKAAQIDAPPDPPTTAWQPGALITDTRTLTIFDDAPPGRYRLLVRVYPLGDPGGALRVRGGPGGQSEDFVWLSWLQVEAP